MSTNESWYNQINGQWEGDFLSIVKDAVAPPQEFFQKQKRKGFFSPPKLIGLAGKARSGKDTVAKMLDDAFCVRRIALADPVRAAVAASLNMTMESYLDLPKEEVLEWLGKSRRQLEQTLGTEWGRNLVNETFWLMVLEKKIEKYRDEWGEHVVVTDIRFDNEACKIREMGGTIWHVIREDAPAVNEHVSEQGILFYPEVDEIILNNGSLSDLAEEVCEAF